MRRVSELGFPTPGKFYQAPPFPHKVCSPFSAQPPAPPGCIEHFPLFFPAKSSQIHDLQHFIHLFNTHSFSQIFIELLLCARLRAGYEAGGLRPAHPPNTSPQELTLQWGRRKSSRARGWGPRLPTSGGTIGSGSKEQPLTRRQGGTVPGGAGSQVITMEVSRGKPFLAKGTDKAGPRGNKSIAHGEGEALGSHGER